MAWVIVIIVITILILFNALYVAAEFATVSARRTRLAQMAGDGNRLARMILPTVEDPQKLDAYIAACQLGITVTSLVLGFYGQASIAEAIAPLLSRLGSLSLLAAQSIAATGVLLILTGLQVVLGELVPKNIGVQYPERLALITAIPMRWSIIAFRPLIWIFNGSGQLILRLFGQSPVAEHAHIHAPEEILILAEESSAGGLLDQEERRLLENTLQLRRLLVRQVMLSRTRMLAAAVDEPCPDLLTLLADSPYSRLPLYEGSIDNIVGVVHLKDLLYLGWQSNSSSVREAMRPVPFVPETMLAEEVFRLLQRERSHLAIVLDEFGGTAGMVTLEDLVEEIFGELQDEFDADTPPIQFRPENRVLVRGDMLVQEVNDQLNLNLPAQEVDTIGGLVLDVLGDIPRAGQEVKIGDQALQVDTMDGNRVVAISLRIEPEQWQKLRGAVR